MTLGIVDDHKLFRKGLISLIEIVFPDSRIVFEADDGVMLREVINLNGCPDIILLDINMPRMDGYAAIEWLKQNYPEVKVMVVSMVETEDAIVRLVKLGVKGYLCKDVEPNELGEALQAIATRGYYFTDFVTGKLVHALDRDSKTSLQSEALLQVNSQELKFLRLACTQMTYVEIAEKMCLSPKTIDSYRNALFEKFNVKNRVGLVLYALRSGLVKLDMNL